MDKNKCPALREYECFPILGERKKEKRYDCFFYKKGLLHISQVKNLCEEDYQECPIYIKNVSEEIKEKVKRL